MKLNIQAADFAGRQANLACLRGDYQASNVWWAIKVHLLYGRPEVQGTLATLSDDELCLLVREQRSASSNLGTAWWTVRHCVVRQKERVVAFCDARAGGVRAAGWQISAHKT